LWYIFLLVIITINDLIVNFPTTNISTNEVEWKNRKFYPKRKNKNRTGLGSCGSGQRVLMDMTDRREMEAAYQHA